MRRKKTDARGVSGLTRKVLALGLSITMVVGGVPAPALAEAAGEVQVIQEQTSRADELTEAVREAALNLAGGDASERITSLYALLAAVPTEGDSSDVEAEALAALRGEASTSVGVTRAFALVAAELGVGCVEVKGADGSSWAMVELGGSWSHVDPARATTADDASWLMLGDAEIAKRVPDAAPWTLTDGGEAPATAAAEETERQDTEAEKAEGQPAGDERQDTEAEKTEGHPAGSESQEGEDGQPKEVDPQEAPQEDSELSEAEKTSEAAEAAEQEVADQKSEAEQKAEEKKADEKKADEKKADEKKTDAKAGSTARKVDGKSGIEAQTAVGLASINHCTITLSQTSYTYDGKQKTPAVTVKWCGHTLKKDTNYTVSYAPGRTNVGTYKVTVTGAMKLDKTLNAVFADSKVVTFQIKKASVANASVSGVSNRVYTGKAHTQLPTVKVGGRTLKKDTDYVLSYKNNVKAGTATMIITGKGNYAGSTSRTFKIQAPSVQYHVHRQTYGNEPSWSKSDGDQSGTVGQAKRLEGIWIRLGKKPVSGSIQYRTHIQTYGWEKNWKADGAMSGTTGQAKRLEAIQIRLTGAISKYYDVWYRVHAQTYGWMGWAKNGASAGTAGYAKRLEAIQIVLVPKGAAAPAANYKGAKRNTSEAFKQYVNPAKEAYAANPTYIDQSKRPYKKLTGTITLKQGPDHIDPPSGRRTPGTMQYVLVVPNAIRLKYGSTKEFGLIYGNSPSSPYFAPYLNRVVTVGANWGYGVQGGAAKCIGNNARVLRTF